MNGCACRAIYATRQTAGSEMLPQELRRGMLRAIKASGSGGVGFRFFTENSMNYWICAFFLYFSLKVNIAHGILGTL
jgi:hypothetical protein